MTMAIRTKARAGIASGSDLRRASIVFLIPLIMLVGSLTWWKLYAGQIEVGPDFCPVSGSLAAHSILLVDRTDTVTDDQKQYLHQALRRIVKDLVPYERFSIYTIDGFAEATPTPLFSRCSPGTAATANIITSSPDRVQADFEHQFLEPASMVIDRIDVAGEAPISPIIETLRTLVTLKDFTADVPRRHLEIFSDMLENTRVYSHYRDSTDFVRLKSSRLYPTIRTSMPGVSVQVDYLPRPRDARFQTEGHLRFWRDFFADAGTKADFVVVQNPASAASDGRTALSAATGIPSVSIIRPSMNDHVGLHPIVEGRTSTENPGEIWVLVQPTGQDIWTLGKAAVSGKTWVASNINVGQPQLGIGEDFLITAVLNPKVSLRPGMRITSIEDLKPQTISGVVRVIRR